MNNLLIFNWQQIDNLEKKSLRDGFGLAVAKLASKFKDVVALSADLTSSTRLEEFKNKYPRRFFQIGVAEQNMIGVAAGLAITGKVPFAASFASFCPGRCLDQIRIQVCLNNLKVKLVGSHAGLSHPKDGASAQATEDIAIMRSLPNMCVVYPADFIQIQKATEAACQYPGPVYLRMTREPTPVFIDKRTDFEIGKAQVLKNGSDITIIAAGPLLAEALKAVVKAEKEGISCEIINLHTIKPVDKITIINSIKKTKKIITVEDHQLCGGLGSAVAEISVKYYPVKMIMMGIKDRFAKTARQYKELLQTFNLSWQDIYQNIKNFI